jgi:hypothetical protein
MAIAGQPTLRQNAGARGKCPGMCSEDTGWRGGAAGAAARVVLDHVDMRTDDDGPATRLRNTHTRLFQTTYTHGGMSKM